VIRKSHSLVVEFCQISERQGLPWGIRAGRDRAGFFGNGSELRGVGERFRAAGGGGGRAGGGEGVFSDAVQHATGHLAVRVAHGFQQRPEGDSGSGQRPLLHHANGT